MMAAISAASGGKQVVLLEKNEKLGKKLYITGKGRCNITNDSDVEHHLSQMTGNRKFMYSAFYTFDSATVIDFFNTMGVATKVERGQRVFPVSDKSSDVIKALAKAMRQNNVQVMLNHEVKELIIDNGVVKGVRTDRGTIESENVIVATGGISYAMTGSTGDGYVFARSCGHSITQPVQGLVPLETRQKDITKIMGLSLRNVRLSLYHKERGNKALYSDVGEMMFTHFGITGPLVLRASSCIPTEAVYKDLYVLIDLKPGLDTVRLDKRLLRDFDKYSKKSLRNGLIDLMPSSLIPIIIQRAGLDEHMPVYSVTREERTRLVEVLKGFRLELEGLRKFNEAIITRGGIKVKEVNPHTMESKFIDNLYFAGEVLDLDSFTGGYNLQIAFSTGYLAGLSIQEKE